MSTSQSALKIQDIHAFPIVGISPNPAFNGMEHLRHNRLKVQDVDAVYTVTGA